MQKKKSINQEQNLISERDKRTHSEPLNLELTLAQLLDAITPENIHSEVQTGEAVGQEIW